MAIYSEKVKAKVLPLLPVKDTVIFPAIPTSVEIFDQRALAALTAAKKDDHRHHQLSKIKRKSSVE